jgi:uncharacterized protein
MKATKKNLTSRTKPIQQKTRGASMKAIMLFFSFILLTNMAFGQESKRYSGPIIDMHLHAFLEQDISGPIVHPPSGLTSPPTPKEHTQQCTALMKEYNIVLAVVDGETPEMVEPWIEILGDDSVISGLRISKKRLEPSIDQFESLVSERKAELFGETAPIYQGLSPSDFTLMPYYAIAEQLNIPVAIHTGGAGPQKNRSFRLRLGDPLLLEDILVAYPNLRVYMMHAGAHFYQRAIIMMYQYPNLYADIPLCLY